jgi:hypothetical protein
VSFLENKQPLKAIKENVSLDQVNINPNKKASLLLNSETVV